MFIAGLSKFWWGFIGGLFSWPYSCGAAMTTFQQDAIFHHCK
jgi:hypothetical protein